MVPSNTRKVLKVMTTTSVKIPLQPTSHFLEKRKRGRGTTKGSVLTLTINLPVDIIEKNLYTEGNMAHLYTICIIYLRFPI